MLTTRLLSNAPTKLLRERYREAGAGHARAIDVTSCVWRAHRMNAVRARVPEMALVAKLAAPI